MERIETLGFKGKEIVLKALIQQKALFPATVNDLPQDAQERTTVQMKNFLQEKQRKRPHDLGRSNLKRSDGGPNIPVIEA